MSWKLPDSYQLALLQWAGLFWLWKIANLMEWEYSQRSCTCIILLLSFPENEFDKSITVMWKSLKTESFCYIYKKVGAGANPWFCQAPHLTQEMKGQFSFHLFLASAESVSFIFFWICVWILKKANKKGFPLSHNPYYTGYSKYIWRFHILKIKVSPCCYKIGGCFLFYFNKREISSLKQREKNEEEKKNQPCRKA